MKILYGIALSVALLGGALVGYQIGAWSLDGARAQLTALDSASEKAMIEHEAMRKKLEEELSTLKAEHEFQVTHLGQAFQAERLALRRSLATTAERISTVEARRQQIADKLNETLKAKEAADGALKAELQKKEQELRNLHAGLENERAGIACLTIAVPNDEIRLINSSHSQRR